jgi:hypothetical protein
MTARIFKVSAAPSVIGIDLARPMVMRVCPERKPALPDATENFVKLHIAHQKGVMLWRNISISVGEVQSDLIISLNRKEWSKAGWGRKPENFNKKSCGRALVVRVDDGMVKFNAHTRDSSYENSFRYSITQRLYSQRPCQGGIERMNALHQANATSIGAELVRLLVVAPSPRILHRKSTL